MTTPIILDVDTGVDDALAIALALADPEIELVACTTVAGNIDITNATNNTLTVLDYLGASHVPVYRGASRPIARPLFMADYFHGIDGLGESNLPKSTRQPGELSWAGGDDPVCDRTTRRAVRWSASDRSPIWRSPSTWSLVCRRWWRALS